MRLKKPKKEFMNRLLHIHLALNIKSKRQMIFQVKESVYTHIYVYNTHIHTHKKRMECKLHKSLASTLVKRRHFQANVNEKVVFLQISCLHFDIYERLILFV